MAVLTLFGQPASPASLTVDTAGYTLGIQFTVSSSGVASAAVTAIWFFSAPTAIELPQHIALFAVTGHVLAASQVPTWSGAAGSGWVRAPFTVPPALTLGASYKACVQDASGNSFYSNTGAYWSTGAGSAGIVNGPLSAPNNAGGDGGQDTFATPSGAVTYPASSFNASNYWVDVEVITTAPPAAGGPPPGGGRSMLARHLAWADL